MKLKNGILSLALLGSLIVGSKSHAVIFPDEAPLTYSDSSSDENEDAVSRFGTDKAKKIVQVAKPLSPISEDSFAHESNRGPASVVESGGRGPAMVPHATKKQAVSQAKREKSYQEVAVIANDSGFYPATLFLTQGIPVRIYITGASAKSQCFMLDQFGVRRQVRSQKIEEVTFTPDQAGTFAFNCPMNGAKGNVIVKELEIGSANVRVPASVSVSQSHQRPETAPYEASQSPAGKSAPDKNVDIKDEDFTPEFR